MQPAKLAVKKVKGKHDDQAEEKSKKRKSETEALPEPSEKHVCPTTEKDQVKAITKYLKAIQKMDIENPQNPTDGDKKNLREGLLLPNLEEVRQGGMYWKRPAFGVYHKGQKRDIAYFQLDESEGDCLLRLGACLKASTLMVT